MMKGKARVRHAMALGSLMLFGLAVLAPLYRPSGSEIPIHSIIQWDTYSYHYPTLLYISDAVRYGKQLPLWNPFLGLGHPVVADPQSQLWSPVTWLVTATTGYGVLAVQAQLIATFLLAGAGAYIAAATLGYRRSVSWAAGASFMFCGYFIGHASHLGTVSTLAWYPWAAAAVLRALRADGAPRRGWAVLGGLALAQCAVQGHPLTALVGAFNVTALYFLWPGGRLQTAEAAAGGEPEEGSEAQAVRRRLGSFVLLSVTAAGAALPLVVGVLWGRKVFAYLQATFFPWEAATKLNALYARNALTLLLPGLSTLGGNEDLRSNDLTMVPSYAGLAVLGGLALAAVLSARSARIRFLLGAAAVNLVLAMGSAFSPRAISYFVVPLMSAPHHASMEFRGYALFYAVLAAGAGWAAVLQAVESAAATGGGGEKGIQAARAWQRRVLAAAGLLGGLGLLSLLYGLGLQGRPDLPKVEVYGGLIVAPLFAGEELMVQGLTALAMAWAIFAARRRPERAGLLLALYVAFDISSSVRRTWEIAVEAAKPNQWAGVLIRERSRERVFAAPRFLTLSPAGDGEAPTDGYVHLLNYNPLRLLPKKEFPDSGKIRAAFSSLLEKRVTLVGTTGTVQITAVRPNGLELDVRTRGASVVRVLMSYAPGWKAGADGRLELLPPSPDGAHYLDAAVPPGRHTVRLEYAPGWVWPTIAVMSGTYVVALAYAFLALRERRNP